MFGDPFMKHVAASLLFILTLGLTAQVFAQAEPSPGIGPNYETRLSTLEDAIRALNGQVEQLSYAIRRLDQSAQRMQSDYRRAADETRKLRSKPAVQAPPPARSQAAARNLRQR